MMEEVELSDELTDVVNERMDEAKVIYFLTT